MWIFTASAPIFLPLYTLLSIFGLLIAVCSTNWIAIWIGLEINLYAFSPILLYSDSPKRKEALTKYFIIQAVGSALLLVSLFISNIFSSPSSILFLLSLLLKGGLAPIHLWLPGVIATSSWFVCLLLSSTQKIAPLFLIINSTICNTELILILGSIIILLGGLGGINQTQLRTIIAYSSVAQIGWITIAAQLNSSITLIILINYITFIIILIILFTIFERSSLNERGLIKIPNTIKYIFMVSLINIAGVPPFPGFIFKALIISTLISCYLIPSIFIILASVLSLYFYIKILFLLYFNTPNQTQHNINQPPFIELTLITLHFSLTLYFIILIIYPWITNLYALALFN